MADVVIIQKQTALERYTRRPLNIDFFEYLQKAGQDVAPLIHAHDSHNQVRDGLLELLTRLGLSFEILNLDEVQDKNIPFYSEDDSLSGFSPKTKLIISLGGDGTLLHASHYVGGSNTLLGVNSCPDHSVGHLCAADPTNFEHIVQAYFSSKASIHAVRRLKVQIAGLKDLPYGLNDVLFSNRHPGATTRYHISLVDRDSGAVQDSERQLSSGIWISAPAGSTAAISSYGLGPLELESRRFLFAVREPYQPPGRALKLLKAVCDGDTQKISLFCRIRQGLVCVDGADSCAFLGFGDTVEVSLPKSCSLRLLVNRS